VPRARLPRLASLGLLSSSGYAAVGMAGAAQGLPRALRGSAPLLTDAARRARGASRCAAGGRLLPCCGGIADLIVAPRRPQPPAPRGAARPLASRLASSALRATQPSVGASVVGVASLVEQPMETATAPQDAETPAAPPAASGACTVASLPRGGAASAPIAARSRRRLGLIP
jgi:hypothetical protein